MKTTITSATTPPHAPPQPPRLPSRPKVIIITGASSGIGEATAKHLAARHHKVVLAARREDRLKTLAGEIAQAGGQATYRVTDVTNPADNAALVAHAKATYGQLDVIFLNAGIMPSSPISALKTDDWRAMIDTNLAGALHGIAAAMPVFLKQKTGQIITTSSIAGLKSFPGAGVYGATKSAVRNLMEVIRMESAMEGTNIRATTLYPAAINTELLQTITDRQTLEKMNKLYDSVGITPEAVARVVAFAIEQPDEVNVSEFTIYPTRQS